MHQAINPLDIQRLSFKLLNGERFLRLVHIPTGIAKEAFVGKDESSLEVNDRLMKELSEKVTGKHS
jgi:hypothetical protein